MSLFRLIATFFVFINWILPWSAAFAQAEHSPDQSYNHPRLVISEMINPPDDLINTAKRLRPDSLIIADSMQVAFQANFKFEIEFDETGIPSAQAPNPHDSAKHDFGGRSTRIFFVLRTKGNGFSVKAAYTKSIIGFNSSDISHQRYYFNIKTSQPRYFTHYLPKGSFEIAAERNGQTASTTVKIDSLCIGIHEVSNEQFRQFLSEQATSEEEAKKWLHWQSRFSRITLHENKWIVRDGENYANHPVVEVTWQGADAFCKWLTETEGQKYRLPTEAEWEFAARSGKSKPMDFPNGENMMGDKKGNFDGTFGQDTTTIAVDYPLDKNAAGLFHFAGNVREWCESLYDSTDSNFSNFRVVRGGSWVLPSKYTRLNFRDAMHQDSSAFDIGFRVVIDHSKKQP